MNRYVSCTLVLAILFLSLFHVKTDAVINKYTVELIKSVEDARNNIVDIKVDGNYIYCIFAEAIGRCSLYRYDTLNQTWKYFFSEESLEFDIDSLYIYTGYAVYKKVDGKKIKELKMLFNNDYHEGILTVVKDGQYLWVGTEDGGLCKYNLANDFCVNYYERTILEAGKEIGGEDISVVIPSDEALFVGRWDGMSILFYEENKWINTLYTKYVLSMGISENIFWIGIGREGLLRMDFSQEPAGINFVKEFEGKYPTDIIALQEEVLVLGEGYGILNISNDLKNIKYISNDEICQKLEEKDNFIRSFALDENVLWIGTNNGLMKLSITD
ncbi:hypothetical protein KAU32_02640 [bacterium]|nr:hypothetical protein [bacterium]